MTSTSKNFLLAGTALALLAGVSFFNKVQDLTNNVKFFIDKFRVHGIVNKIYLRVFTTVRIINQAQSTLSVSDLQVFVQYLDANKTPIDLGASAASTSFTVLANQTLPLEIGTDLNLLSVPYDKIPGLLKGEKVVLRITSSFTAFGQRITIPSDQAIQLPSLVISIISFLIPKK